MPVCSVCGGTEFADHRVLWPELVAEWQLSPEEHAYVDRQQGTQCRRCGANLRSIALADALRAALGSTGTLSALVGSDAMARLRILEINEAGTLTPVLRRLPGHVLATYPAVDMHAMPYPDEGFDLVIHSDTLEHVAQPVRALAECRRVLRPGGTLVFTVPTIVGRMTRGRAGLPKSFHGAPGQGAEDFVVWTEYGADMWTHVLRAGFTAVTINAVEFPAALAMTARRPAAAA